MEESFMNKVENIITKEDFETLCLLHSRVP